LAKGFDSVCEQFVGCHQPFDFAACMEDGGVIASADAPSNFWKRIFGQGFCEVASDLAGSNESVLSIWRSDVVSGDGMECGNLGDNIADGCWPWSGRREQGGVQGALWQGLIGLLSEKRRRCVGNAVYSSWHDPCDRWGTRG